MGRVEQFFDHLYVVRGVGEKPNKKEIKQLREIARALGEIPAFVGVTPYGSTVKGYINESSDLDIAILIDSSNDGASAGTEEEIKSRLEEILGVDTFNCTFVDVNPHLTSADDKIPLTTENGTIYPSRRAVCGLTSLATGKGVKDLREQYREKIGSLSDKQKVPFKNGVVELLLVGDGLSLKKMAERIPELVGREEELLEARRELWKQRYDRVWS